ncbi:unnamed protein product [Ilex paraguariensis]|uniref:Uncharacterized protein n=1 Tax=Ilex paraguariensis TaxID=185542 RepID=A0ABC8SJT0_9AQUA
MIANLIAALDRAMSKKIKVKEEMKKVKAKLDKAKDEEIKELKKDAANSLWKASRTSKGRLRKNFPRWISILRASFRIRWELEATGDYSLTNGGSFMPPREE